MNQDPAVTMNRRHLIKNTAFTAAGVALARTATAATTAPGKKIRLGLIGCGGRGQWIAELFAQHGGYQLVAGADYFQDKLDSFSKKFGVPADKLYSGLSGYQKLLEDGGVDAVAIESPPYFHPEQARAAVEAGKHVYLAKPIAVDVPGCQSVEQSAAAATKKGLCFLVDFQTRADEAFQTAIAKTHDGAIGKYSFGESLYHAGVPFEQHREAIEKDPNNPEVRLRAWGIDRILSGDIITEQNIHTIDVTSWIMNAKPLAAVGNCSQNVRTYGNCKDHFSVIYRYADDVDVSFTSRQFAGHGTQPEGIKNRMFGNEGVLEAAYAGQILLRGKDAWRGKCPGLYKTGAITNIDDFHKAVSAGDAANPTVAPSVESNLLTILGRSAAYTGKQLTWDEMITANEAWTTDLDLKA